MKKKDPQTVSKRLFLKNSALVTAGLFSMFLPAIKLQARTFLTQEQAKLVLFPNKTLTPVPIELSKEQKKAFVAEFKTFLLQSYATGLLNASGNEKVVYEPINLAPGADKVKVKAQLISASGEAYPIILSMSNRKDTQWRAYNLEVAGINFIRTYRSSFSQTLQQKGIDGLVADLRKKNAR